MPSKWAVAAWVAGSQRRGGGGLLLQSLRQRFASTNVKSLEQLSVAGEGGLALLFDLLPDRGGVGPKPGAIFKLGVGDGAREAGQRLGGGTRNVGHPESREVVRGQQAGEPTVILIREVRAGVVAGLRLPADLNGYESLARKVLNIIVEGGHTAR